MITTETLMRRTFLAGIAATTGSLILPAGIRAQSSTYPSKPVRFIVGLGPGSGADTGHRREPAWRRRRGGGSGIAVGTG